MQIPGYTIIRELGRGGMATVYLATQDRLNRQVALKVMEPISGAIEDFTHRFAKEGQIIAQFQHPQIITIYDFNSYNDIHYFSMEFLPGGTLAERIPQGLPLERILEIVTKVAEALAYAHERGVIHRDLKPQNILFRADGTPVLSDFGIAKIVTGNPDATQLTRLGTAIGSPRYMSPEQITSRTLDARSDLYSLGLVFFEMLTRQQPYQADDVISLAMKHCAEPAPPLPEDLSALQPVLDKLLAKNPADRFDSAGQFIRSLERIDARRMGQPPDDDETRIVSPAPTRARAIPERTPRSRKGLAIGGVFLVIAAAGIGAYWYFIRQPTSAIPEITAGLPPVQKDRSTIATEYERIAIEHFQRQEYQQSLESARQGLTIAPGDARLLALSDRIQAYRTAAELLREAAQRAQDGSFEQSLQLIQQGLQEVPNHSGLKALYDEVQRQFRESKNKQAGQLLTKARTHQQQGDLDGAMKLVEEGLGLLPDDASLKSLREAISAQMEQRTKVTTLLTEARERQGQNALDESLALIEQGLRVSPDNAQLLELRRTVQDQQRQRQQERAAAMLAQAHQQQGKGALQAALKLIDEGLQEVPSDPDLLAYRAQLKSQLAAKGRVDGLLRGCGQAFPIGRLSAETIASAAACYGQVIELDPANGEARTQLDRLADLSADWATAALSGGELNKAESLLTELSRLSPNHPKLAQLTLDLKAKRDEAAAHAKQKAEDEARQQAQRQLAPEMVPIKGGCYEMGSPQGEPNREKDEHQHKACVKDFSLGKYEVKVKEFRRFVDATGYQTLAERAGGADPGCWALDQSDTESPWSYRSWANWRKPNKYRGTQEDEPVTCVSWTDADAYIRWLNKVTGGHYRLPTEAEWEYGARAGTTTARFWGEGVDARACDYANVADVGHKWADGFPCDDGNEWVATVGSYRPNPWGLYDMLGNVWEWTCSAYDPEYGGAEKECMGSDPAVPLALRGGSWYSGPKPVRAAYRDRNYAEVRYNFLGFRLAGD